MTRREEAQEFLKGQLEILRGLHVASLMKARQHGKLEKKLEDIELDFSLLKEYWDFEQVSIYQNTKEIPKDFLLELGCYMQQSKFMNDVYFQNIEDYEYLLLNTGEEVAEDIAGRADEDDLCNYTIEGLISE